jgi:hypothetical protein
MAYKNFHSPPKNLAGFSVPPQDPSLFQSPEEDDAQHEKDGLGAELLLEAHGGHVEIFRKTLNRDIRPFSLEWTAVRLSLFPCPKENRGRRGTNRWCDHLWFASPDSSFNFLGEPTRRCPISCHDTEGM